MNRKEKPFLFDWFIRSSITLSRLFIAQQGRVNKKCALYENKDLKNNQLRSFINEAKGIAQEPWIYNIESVNRYKWSLKHHIYITKIKG